MKNQFEFDFKTIEKPKTFEDIIDARVKAGTKIGFADIQDLFQEYLKIFPAKNKQETNIRFEEFKEELRGVNSRAHLGINEKILLSEEGYLRLTRQFNDVGEDEEIFSDLSGGDVAAEAPVKAPEIAIAPQSEKSDKYDNVRTHISEIEKALNKKENDQE